MSYSRKNAAFLTDKQGFFNHVYHAKEIDGKISEADKLAVKHDYKFLLENQITLETEFVQLFAVLQKQKDQDSEAFWLYCYYCATMLETFYKAYSHETNKDKYTKLKKKIKNRLTGATEAKESEKAFILHLQGSFSDSFKNIMKIPSQLSTMRDYVGYANLMRLYWVFNRLTITKGLAFAKELQFIEKLDAILGTHTDVDKIISIFQAPNGVLNYLSVGFFLINFVIDAGLLVKHTLIPPDGEYESSSSAYDRFKSAYNRFKYELYKRHANFINNGTWAAINLLTNFPELTGLSGPAAGAITAVFLGFDVCQFMYQVYVAKQEYSVKKAQYLQQIMEYRDPEKFKELTDTQRLKHITILEDQCRELELELQTKYATLYFGASAAGLLMVGFSATLIFTPAFVTVVAFLACEIAIAMYLSRGSYSTYQGKSLRLEHAEMTGNDLTVARREFEIARNDFIYAMAKNTIAPIVLITTFAICWPAAIALTALYVGLELFHSYDQHSSKEEVKVLAGCTM